MSSGQQAGNSAGPANRITGQLEPVVREAIATIGFDLELLDVQQAGRRRLVKVVVDGDEGIGLDEIAKTSRAVSEVLDEHEHVLAGPYTLEVTSPGLDRPLTKPRHWRRAKFRLVKVRQVDGTQLIARVGHAGDDRAQVLVDGQLQELPYDSVDKAVVEVEFRQAPAAELALLEQGIGHNEYRDGREEPKS